MLSKHIIITGSTRGIGYGLAEAILSLGCSVTVSGRGQEAVDKAVAGLASRYEAKRILRLACNVTIPKQVQSLWDVSIRCFGKVDILISYLDYPRYDQAYELYNLEEDPEELQDLSTNDTATLSRMKAELLENLTNANHPFEKSRDTGG